MGRLGTCGWEMLDVSDGGFWDTASGCSVTAPAARTGNRGLRVNAAFDFVAKQFKPNGTTDDYFGRIWTEPQTSFDIQTKIIICQDSGTGQNVFSIRANTDDTLELWKEGSTPAQIGSDSAAITVYSAITWEYDQSTTTVTAYINGVSFASGTCDASHDNASTIIIGAFDAIGAGDWYFDDFAHNDQNGSAETGLPDWRARCYVAMPNAAGDNADGTRGGTDSGSDVGQVDEQPPNDSTDYYILDVNNDRLDLTCTITSAVLPAGATVNLVQVGIRVRAAAASQMSFQVHVKSQSAGTTLSSATQTNDQIAWLTNGGGTLPRNYLLASYTDPQAGGPWTAALLDTIHFGYTAIDAAPDVWCSTLWVYVDYTEGGFQPAWARAHNQLLYDGGPLVH